MLNKEKLLKHLNKILESERLLEKTSRSFDKVEQVLE